MVGRFLVGFVWLNLQFSVMVGRLLVGFVWLNLQISVSWQVYFQWGLCGSIFSFLCHGWQTFSGVRVAQSLVFCVMVAIYIYIYIGRLLVGFVWLNLQFSVAWLVDFQWGSCVSIFSFLCHGWQLYRLIVGFVWLYLQFSMIWQVEFQLGSCGSIFRFLCHVRQTFSGVRVSQSLVFCVMVGRLLVGFVWLNLQFSVSWQVDFQWGSCGSIFSFLWHSWQTFSGVRVSQPLVFCVMVGRLLVGFVWLNLQFCVMVGRLLVGFVWLNRQFSVLWQVDFQWGSCGSIVSFLCYGRWTFSGVRVAQSLVFCVMVGSYIDLQWASCGSIFRFLCHVRQTFSGVRVSQSLVFCVMVGRLLVGFVWLNLQFSVSWQVDFQWGSCGSIFSFLSWLIDFQWGSCGSISSFLCHGRQTFSGVRVAQSLVFCVMVGRLLVGFVWLKLQFSVSWQVDFQWGSCGPIFSFLRHGWQTFSGDREAQSLVFCVKVGDFQWGSCGSIFSFVSHGWQTFSRVRVAQSLVFCVIVRILLVGFVCLNLQFSASWLVDFQWGS